MLRVQDRREVCSMHVCRATTKDHVAASLLPVGELLVETPIASRVSSQGIGGVQTTEFHPGNIAAISGTLASGSASLCKTCKAHEESRSILDGGFPSKLSACRQSTLEDTSTDLNDGRPDCWRTSPSSSIRAYLDFFLRHRLPCLLGPSTSTPCISETAPEPHWLQVILVSGPLACIGSRCGSGY